MVVTIEQGSVAMPHEAPVAIVSDGEMVALELLPYGVVVADDAGRLTIANRAARVLFGLHEKQADDVTLRHEGRSTCLGALIREHAAGPQLRRHVDLKHPENGWLRATLTQGEGVETRWVHIVVERVARRDWRWAGRSDPLSAFAHELRNALTPLQEGLALMSEGAAGPLTEAQGRFLEAMKTDSYRMMRLMQDMVAADGGGSSGTRFSSERVDLGVLVREVARSFGPAATKAGVALDLGGIQGGAVCQGDRDLLTQVLSNLVSNALKFTPPGGTVFLSAARTSVGGAPAAELAVRDTGPGLTPEQVEQLLAERQPWGSVRPSEARSRCGLGIGLSLAREMIEQHGGRLVIEGEPGVGSCFRVVVPADLGRDSHWRLGQIREAVRLAAAVAAPLSIIEIGLLEAGGGQQAWSAALGEAPAQLAARCLEETLRPSDTVLLGRSRITLILHGVGARGAALIAERVLGALLELLSRLRISLPECGIGLGLASYPDDAASAADLLSAAECAVRQGPVRSLHLTGVGAQKAAAPVEIHSDAAAQ